MRPKKINQPPQPKSPERALETLRWLCSKMERSEYDAKQSLRRWMVDPEKWQEIIDVLVNEKFIDNARYARAFIGEKLRTKQWGETKIRYALRIKQIDRSIIDDVFEELLDKDQVNENLTEQLNRRYHSELRKSDDKYKVKNKLYRWAASRGFESSDIIAILDKLINDEDFY